MSLLSAQQKTLGKLAFAVKGFAECKTRQTLCRVFLGLRRVPLALDKAPVSRSEASLSRWLCNSVMGNAVVLELDRDGSALVRHGDTTVGGGARSPSWGSSAGILIGSKWLEVVNI